MENKEIFEIFNSSSSKTELCNKLNLDINHRNSIYVDNLLKDIMNESGFEIDITANGFKQRRLEREKKKWEEEKPVCKNCGKILPFEKRRNKFCSESCAASYNNSHRKHSEETKKKISRSINKYLEHIQKDEDYHTRICCICGKRFSLEDSNLKYLSKRKTCSDECQKKLKIELGKKSYQKLKEEGRFVGWKTRNLTSYAEKFWIEVLDKNKIQYIREKKIDKYFLDFYIEKNNKIIDLEIDGKQHKYEDRKISDKERDKYLQSIGILIYRIPWNSINKKEGKQLMKEKIDKFLEFYNSL